MLCDGRSYFASAIAVTRDSALLLPQGMLGEKMCPFNAFLSSAAKSGKKFWILIGHLAATHRFILMHAFVMVSIGTAHSERLVRQIFHIIDMVKYSVRGCLFSVIGRSLQCQSEVKL